MSKHITSCFLIPLGTLTALGGALWLARPWEEFVIPSVLSPAFPALLSRQDASADPAPSLSSVSTLVQQARCFGHYLKASPTWTQGARNENRRRPNRLEPKVTVNIQPVRPHTVSPRFQVMAISVYPSRPEKSMALISEPGADSHWVQCRDKVGPISIEAIHRQYVIWCYGEQTGRVTVTTGRAQERPAAALPAPAPQPQVHPKPLAQKERLTVRSPRMKSKPTTRNLNPTQ